MKLRKILMGLAAVVGFTTAATAATTPIVTVDGDNVTIQNTTGNAGNYSWANKKAATLCIPAAADLEADTRVKIKSFQFWCRGQQSNNSYADRVTVRVNGLAYTTDVFAGQTTTDAEMTYSFPVGQEPIVAVGTTYDVSFILPSGKTGLRFRAGEKGSGSDGFFQMTGDTTYAPQLVLKAVKTTDEPKAAYPSVLSLNFNGSGTRAVADGTDPGACVSDTNWKNFTDASGTGVQVGTAFVNYSSKNNYNKDSKYNVGYMKGYLDDGNGVSISVTNLTGVAYDVYIYCASDGTTAWPYKKVNGTDYTALSNGEATLGTAVWGDYNSSEAVLGSNVMVVRSVVPAADGTITIASQRNGGYRGSIAAIQLGEIEKVIPKEFSLDLSESASWSSADWKPSLPEGGMTSDAVATVTATGNPELTLDGTITVGTLKIVSGEGDMLTLKKDAGANTSFVSLDVSAAANGTTWDATEGFTACNALLTAARTGDYKFYFLGEGENGATLDYGTAKKNYTFSGHYIFDGGVHTFQNNSDSQYLEFAANATVENPTFWVEDDTTLNWKARNPCGWNAAASDAGIVRIGNGAKVVTKNADANAGTWYWSQQFYLEDGATLEIGTTGDNFRTVGNDAEKPHFVVPSGATAEIAGGADNYFALPANNGGAAVFDVGADATLTVSAKLKTLANGKPFVKYGAGTLKVTGDASAFSAAIQVKEGTLEYASATALGAAATIAVDEGATLKITADEDYTFSTAVSGAGYVVKADRGALGVTPGQFGDNLVSIEDGDLDFTITHEQAVAPDGVVFCKAAEDLSESGSVFVYNAAHETITGEFSFENNTLTFKANSVDFVQTIDGDIEWSNMVGWEDSPESTITLTNVADKAKVDFNISVEAKSLKIVSTNEPAAKVTVIPYGCFLDENMAIASYDFSEALGGVQIDFNGAEAGEIPLVTGATIKGFENIAAINVPEGTGLYADASHIWLCKTANTTFANPVTGEEKTIAQAFFGTTDATWDNLANWRVAQNGVWTPATKIPGVQDGGYGPLVLDGNMTSEKTVAATRLEGWDAQYALYKGMNVTVETLTKLQSNTAGRMFIWVDATSSITFGAWGSGNSAGDISFAVAAEDGITFNMPYSKGNTINYNMAGDGSVNYAGGVSAGTHNLTNGTLKVGGDGFTGGTLNVVGDAALVTPALTATVNIAADTTLSLTSTAEGDLTIAGNWANNGTLNVKEGTVVFMPGVTPGTYTENGGKVIIGQTVTINDCGKIAVTGETTDDVRLFDIGGNPVAVTKVEGGYAFYDWDVTGKNCWWDYEFNGDVKSTGTDTTAMNNEGTKPYYNEDETALRVGYGTPWRNASYPEEFTAVIYGKMVNNTNHMEIGFGSTTSGTKLGVVIACGDPLQNEVRLLVTSGYGVVETIPMKATDPYDTNHLYAFTCQTINDGGVDKTKVSVYLDGKFLQAYTFDEKITLGTGFQVGSIHGGNLSGAIKATKANTHADLDFLRVYQTVLNADAMAKYAEKYPYTSKGGASERTFADAAEDWVADEGTPWTVTPFEAESFPTNSALAGSVVTIAAATEGEAEIAMNLAEPTTYESLTVEEGSGLVVSLVDGCVAPTVTGLAEIKADVTVSYDAINFGTVEVASDKTLTFDFDAFPFDAYYQSMTIPFTGATSGEGTITAVNLPTEGVRTATFEKNPSTDQYELKIAIPEGTAFVYTIAQGEETGTWTWGGEEVAEETVDANPGTPIQKEGDGTLQKDLASRSYIVNEGLLTTTNAVDKTATITVNKGATFDFNGSANGYITMFLNGGTLVNNGAMLYATQRQMQGLTLTDDSTVGGTDTGYFGLISDGYNPNVLELGGHTLTKTGGNFFYLCNTTVSNGTINVTEGTLRITDRRQVTFSDNAKLILQQGATLNTSQALTIGAITAYGATIQNKGSITPFALTGSATLTGSGTWGTNTIDGAAVTIGTKRDFVFAGNGTVNVTLTDAEYEAGQATLFTNDVGAESVVGTVMYDDQDITEKCTVSGNQITAIQKVQPVDPSQGGEIPCPTAQAATNLAEQITAKPADYIKAPEGLDEYSALLYQSCFMAEVAPDGTTVTLKLNEDGVGYLQGIVDEATDNADIAAALCDPTAESVTYADGTFMLGFYYWVAGGTDVAQPLATNADAVQPIAAGSMTLGKPDLGETTSGFYVIKADFKNPSAE